MFDVLDDLAWEFKAAFLYTISINRDNINIILIESVNENKNL